MSEKFALGFDIVTRDQVEASITRLALRQQLRADKIAGAVGFLPLLDKGTWLKADGVGGERTAWRR